MLRQPRLFCYLTGQTCFKCRLFVGLFWPRTTAVGACAVLPSVPGLLRSKFHACRLPDGTFWPEIIEGTHNVDHGVVICKLCNRNMKENNFTGHGYR